MPIDCSLAISWIPGCSLYWTFMTFSYSASDSEFLDMGYASRIWISTHFQCCWSKNKPINKWSGHSTNDTLHYLVSPNGNQPWLFIGRTDAEAETPMLWPPDAKNWLLWKDPDAAKDWRQEEKGTTENEMVGWVWASSRSWWWTGKLGMLQSMGSQRIGHDWATEQNKWSGYSTNKMHHRDDCVRRSSANLQGST